VGNLIDDTETQVRGGLRETKGKVGQEANR
jgi:uncharacterized protein YjbJ (UPF0337 family)